VEELELELLLLAPPGASRSSFSAKRSLKSAIAADFFVASENDLFCFFLAAASLRASR